MVVMFQHNQAFRLSDSSEIKIVSQLRNEGGGRGARGVEKLKTPGEKKKIQIMYPFFARPKNGYPQERAPRRFAPCGSPRKAFIHGGGPNSHIRALRQRAARYP